MRDYKNVRVPRSYRGENRRTPVKRVRALNTSVQPRKGGGLTGALIKIMAVIVLAGAVYLGWLGYRAATHADMFVVSGVDISGVHQLGEKDLREIAAIFTGQNIFRVDIDAAVRRAHANPWIKEATVYRKLPNRITMVFVERVPSFILDTGAARFLLDSEAVVIERIAKDGSPAWPLPVVTIAGCHARPGEQAASESMTEAMMLLSEIAARGGWNSAEVTVRANSPASLSIVYAGHEFKMGSGRYGEKLRRLAEVMADVKERGLEISYVDLRPERQAAVMVKREQYKVPGTKFKGKSPKS
jgi:cell division septal protein FtsQ